MSIMKKFSLIAFSLALIIGAFFVLSFSTRAESQLPREAIIFNEIMWSGSFVSSSDEWIELYNTTGQKIDLTGWQITKYSSVGGEYQENLMLTIGEGNDLVRNTIIPAGGFFLISNYDKTNEKTTINVLPDVVDDRVSLLNNKLELKIYPANWEMDELIDVAGDKGKPPAGNNTTKASMVRLLPPQDGSLKESWTTSEESKNLKEGSLELASPENSQRVIAQLSVEPQSGTAPLAVNFDASASLDLSESELLFEWDFDGEEENFLADATSESAIFEYIYENTGSFLASVKVTNSADQSDIFWVEIEVTEEPVNQPPQAKFSASPQVGTVPLKVTFNAEESSDDQEVVSFLWDFGDGSQGEGKLVEHTFNKTGTLTIRLTVKDVEGLSSSTTLSITVQAPEYSEDIIINELYPRPSEGSNYEFIELYNQGEDDINLKGWQLDDAKDEGSAPYTITTDKIILASSFLSFTKEETKISLNDIGDMARLIAPDGKEKNKTPNYGSSKKGQSYSLINNQWRWTSSVTKNAANVLTEPEKEETEEEEVEEENAQETTSSLNTGSPRQIIFSELLPKPIEGEDEFIELYNSTEETVDIINWVLEDAGGKKYTIKSEDFGAQSLKILATGKVKIRAGEYLNLERGITKIALNDTGGETVYLFDEAGNLIDKISYSGSVKKGASYTLDSEGNWQWSSTVTPGEENIVTVLATTPKTSGGKSLATTGMPEGIGIIMSGLVSLIGISIYRFSTAMIILWRRRYWFKI